MALTAAQITSLKTIRANLISHLETESAKPKPTYTIGNQTIQWHQYYQQKLAEIRELDALIEEQENDGDAWDVRSVGCS